MKTTLWINCMRLKRFSEFTSINGTLKQNIFKPKIYKNLNNWRVIWPNVTHKISKSMWGQLPDVIQTLGFFTIYKRTTLERIVINNLVSTEVLITKMMIPAVADSLPAQLSIQWCNKWIQHVVYISSIRSAKQRLSIVRP